PLPEAHSPRAAPSTPDNQRRHSRPKASVVSALLSLRSGRHRGAVAEHRQVNTSTSSIPAVGDLLDLGTRGPATSGNGRSGLGRALAPGNLPRTSGRRRLLTLWFPAGYRGSKAALDRS